MLSTSGVKLKTPANGIAKAEVLDYASKVALPWDRYMRLHAAGEAFSESAGELDKPRILDVGGADGALALFLPGNTVEVIDPDTTGGDVFTVAAHSYDVVFAIDVIEHVEPRQRVVFMAQLARICRHVCILNYPIPESMTAQKLTATVTNNPFIAEHVRLGLPYSSTVERSFEDSGFQCLLRRHTSRSLWLTYMALLQSAPETAQLVSRYLIEEHTRDNAADPLYELVVAKRIAALS